MPELTTKDAQLEKIVEMTASIGLLAPVGVVQAFAGSTTPEGWLLCDGSAVSRTDYADLYTVIGDAYGAGDGSTTFNLPNLVDKFIEGSAAAGTEKTAGLPNITGSAYYLYVANNKSNGALSQRQTDTSGPSGGASKAWGTVDLDASKSNAIYGNSNTVQPPALTMRYIIKY